MKDIPVEELAAISPEIHEAAVRVGCTHVALTGRIWPGGQVAGPAELAARFAEFSWLRAALVNGSAIFEEADPKRFAELLVTYGLSDEAAPMPAPEFARVEDPPAANVSTVPLKIDLIAAVLPATKRELEREAKAEGISIGELLDWKFQPRVAE